MDKTPFYENLYVDIYDNIKSIDVYNEAHSHLSSANIIDYQKAYNNYISIEQLQSKSNRIIYNLVSKLEKKLIEILQKYEDNNDINIENLLSYLTAYFIEHQIYNSQDIISKIRELKEKHDSVVFYNTNPNLIPIRYFLSLKTKEKIIFNELIDSELQEIINQMKGWKEYYEGIKNELEIFKKNVMKISHDLDTSNLEGECEQEFKFKFQYKLKKKIRVLISKLFK